MLPATVAKERRASRSWKNDIVFVGSSRGFSATLYGLAVIILLLGLLVTRSRTGITLGIVGIILAVFAFRRRLTASGGLRWISITLTFAIAIGLAVALIPLLQRFSSPDIVADQRWTVYATTYEGIAAFFPVGSGPGTFAQVYPRFQPQGLYVFVNHAHNDYLELVFESGIFGVLFALILLWLFVRRWTEVLADSASSSGVFIQIGAGIGLTLMLLHGVMDFNWHIPANLVLFAFFGAVFFRRRDLAEAKPARPHDKPATARAAKSRRQRPNRADAASSPRPNIGDHAQKTPFDD